MNIPNILDFLRRPASGSEGLRAKLSEVEAAFPGAEAEATRLAADRASLLLTATDREIEAVERREADARRSVDRLRAAREEIAKRLAVAEADEARAALDAERVEAERIAAETAAKVAKVYPRAAREISDLIEALDVAERRVARVNEALTAAGRLGELLPEVESRALPEPAEVSPIPFKLRSASLPPAPSLGFPGIGRARQQAEIAGIVAAQIG